jgi:predicted secreted hydrolase
MCLLWPGYAMAAEGYAVVDGPCQFEFPRDHGPHENHRTEWWYYTGNLEDEDGRAFGFQFTIFRSRLEAPGLHAPPEKPSPWRSEQIYIVHAAVTDITGEAFYHAEETARGSAGLAGALVDSTGAQVFIGNAQAHIQEDRHSLKVAFKDFSYDLNLKPQKPIIAHGDGGYSLKGIKPQSASCYYSITRFAVQGEIRIKGRRHKVRGQAWWDREYASEILEEDVAGWDWFALQLSDGSDFKCFFMRKKEGGFSTASSGTFVDANGEVLLLKHSDMSVEDLGFWESAANGARYPILRRLRVPKLGLDLLVRSRLEDQEMRNTEDTGIAYYEGSVSVEGTRGKRSVTGLGYLEMTGYAGELGERLE